MADPVAFLKDMEQFPCIFNLPPFDLPNRSRLKLLSRKLNDEIGVRESCSVKEDERRMLINLLTWIHFQLCSFSEAREKNRTNLEETGNENVVSLGNGAFLDWYTTKEPSRNLQLLLEMTIRPDFQEKLMEARSEQAYCLGRLGNMSNLTAAVSLYENILAPQEDRKDWRCYMGIAYRRLATCQSSSKYVGHCMTRADCFRKAEECFRQVKQTSSDTYLQSLALAELAELRIEDLFRGNTPKEKITTEVNDLVGKALAADGSEMFFDVILGCGKALLHLDEMKSIELLTKAVNIRNESVVGHHYLGKAFIKLSKQEGIDRNTRNDHQLNAIHHLTRSYDYSLQTNAGPLAELSRLFQGRKNTEMAIEKSFLLLQSKFNRGKLTYHLNHFYLLKNSSRQMHLLLAFLATIDTMCDISSRVECNAVWTNFFENTDIEVTDTKPKDLLRMLNKHGKKTEAIPELVAMAANGQIDDLGKTIGKVDQFLSECKTEEALLLLELLLIHPQTFAQELQEIHIKLLIGQAKKCLTDGFTISSLFFRKAFNLSYDRSQERNGDDEPKTLSINVNIVLLFHDPNLCRTYGEEIDLDGDNRKSLCADTAHGMEEAISTLFDLTVTCNPSLCGVDGDEGSHWLEEFVQKHQSKLVLLLVGQDDERVESYVQWIQPLLQGAMTDKPTVAVVQCDQDASLELPPLLSQLPRLWLRCQRGKLPVSNPSIPNQFRSKTAQDEASVAVRMREIVEAYFDGNDEDVSKFFTFLLKPGHTKH